MVIGAPTIAQTGGAPCVDRRAILLLAAGISLSPLAHAQFLNVSLYGNLNLDLEVVNGAQSDGSNPAIMRVSSNSSRFGLRGHEYVGHGLVAIFQLESTVLGDSGGSTLASRETWVGLQGDWGTLKLGNFLTPYDDIHTIFGNPPTLTTSILSTAALWAQGALSKVEGGFDARLGNSIRYETPPLQGFSAALQFATSDTSGRSERRRQRRPSVGVEARERHLRRRVLQQRAGRRRHRVRAQLPDTPDRADRRCLVDHRRLRFRHDRQQCRPARGRRLRAAQLRHANGKPDARLLRIVVDVGGRGRHVLRVLGQGRRWQRERGRRHDDRSAGQGCRTPRASNGSCRTATTCRCARCSTPDGCKIDNRANAAYTFNINPYPVAPGAKPGGVVFGIAHFF